MLQKTPQKTNQLPCLRLPFPPIYLCTYRRRAIAWHKSAAHAVGAGASALACVILSSFASCDEYSFRATAQIGYSPLSESLYRSLIVGAALRNRLVFCLTVSHS